MKELSNLKKLSEAAGTKTGNKKMVRFVLDMDHALDSALDDLDKVQMNLQSQVLSDMFKAEGFPDTEANAAKKAMRKAVAALSDAVDEIQQLHQAVSMHFEPPQDN